MNKSCKGICENCLLIGKKLTQETINNEKVFYNLEYFIENFENIDKNKKIVLIKLNHDKNDFQYLKGILKINYVINYNDLNDKVIYNKIIDNLKFFILFDVKINMHIICNNIDEIIDGNKKITTKFNMIYPNFYTNFLFSVKQYDFLKIKKIEKKKIKNMIDINNCTHEIMKNWKELFEYKSLIEEEIINEAY